MRLLCDVINVFFLSVCPQSLCAVIDRSEQNFQDEFNVYENESKSEIF